MKHKYYAVKRGRKTGIFRDWPTTQKLVGHYPHPVFKSFRNYEDAKRYLNGQSPKMVQSSSGITIYTDGGSRNTGVHLHQHVKSDDKSAWAFLICLHGHRYSGTGSEWGATNNRMEIMALVQALQWLIDHHDESLPIVEVADSRYVLNAITKHWLANWQRQGWRLSSGGPLKNRQLWQKMAQLLTRFPHLKFKWTKGHAHNLGNIFVDHLLNKTMDRMRKGHRPPKRVDRAVSSPDRRSKIPENNQQKSNAGNRSSIEAIKKNLKRMGFLQN